MKIRPRVQKCLKCVTHDWPQTVTTRVWLHVFNELTFGMNTRQLKGTQIFTTPDLFCAKILDSLFRVKFNSYCIELKHVLGITYEENNRRTSAKLQPP